MTEVFTATDLANKQVTEYIENGKIGVIPTDTVYGLVCSAKDKAAVKRIYEVKKRSNKPGTIIAKDTEQLVKLGLKKRYLKAVEHLWPAPISVVIPCYGRLDYLHMGEDSLAVRIPLFAQLINLMDKTGPLQTSSANISGKPDATNIDQAKKYFGQTVDFYVDGGDLSDRQPSTVVRVTDDVLEVLREGAVKIDDKGRILQ